MNHRFSIIIYYFESSLPSFEKGGNAPLFFKKRLGEITSTSPLRIELYAKAYFSQPLQVYPRQ